MMTWMMPLMFGFWSLTVPAGLALYWAVSNLAGIVLQYFYMGRKFEWKSLLQFGPPAPAPAVAAAQADKPRPVRDHATEDSDGRPGSRSAKTTPPAAAEHEKERNGRRRGKR